MYLFSEATAIFIVVLAFFLVVDHRMNSYASSIDLKRVNRVFDSIQAKVPTLDLSKDKKEKTKYVITGGAGFIGAWIARFLLLRNDTDIYLLDNNSSIPGDLTKHGAKRIFCDLTDKGDLTKAVAELAKGENPESTIVVFHAAALQRYFLSTWLSLHKRIANKNVEMVQNVIDVFADLAATSSTPVYIINIGDAIGRSNSVPWCDLFKTSNWSRDANKTDMGETHYVSSFAKSKAESQELILEANNGKTLITSSIELQGIVCGYYGESLLSPCMYYKGALNHCWGIPMSFLHVEDVARAALLLEIRLRGEETTKSVQAVSFLVSNGQLMRMNDVFALIKESTELRVIRINPALVYFLSFFTLMLSVITSSGRNGWKMRDDSLFSGRWWSLTPSRFTTLQSCQIPNEKRMMETKKALGFEAARTTRDTIISTVSDYKRINEHMGALKKAREDAEKEETLKKFEKEHGSQPDKLKNI